MALHGQEGERGIGPGTVKRHRGSEGLGLGRGFPAWKTCDLPWTNWTPPLDMDSRSDTPGFLSKCSGLSVTSCLPTQMM